MCKIYFFVNLNNKKHPRIFLMLIKINNILTIKITWDLPLHNGNPLVKVVAQLLQLTARITVRYWTAILAL